MTFSSSTTHSLSNSDESVPRTRLLDAFVYHSNKIHMFTTPEEAASFMSLGLTHAFGSLAPLPSRVGTYVHDNCAALDTAVRKAATQKMDDIKTLERFDKLFGSAASPNLDATRALIAESAYWTVLKAMKPPALAA